MGSIKKLNFFSAQTLKLFFVEKRDYQFVLFQALRGVKLDGRKLEGTYLYVSVKIEVKLNVASINLGRGLTRSLEYKISVVMA